MSVPDRTADVRSRVRTFSPWRWAAWTGRGREVPDYLEVFAAWECEDSFAFGGPDLDASFRSAKLGQDPDAPDPKLLWVILAPDQSSARARYNELMGWNPYIPMDGVREFSGAYRRCRDCWEPDREARRSEYVARIGWEDVALCRRHAEIFCKKHGALMPEEWRRG